MMVYPAGFRADLRHPVCGSAIGPWFQWSSQRMFELSVREPFRFILGQLGPRGQRVLEVGCGPGHVALELARVGNRVVGLDPSADALEVAERSAREHPRPEPFGDLQYVCAPFEEFKGTDGSFDAVVFNRSLHHVADLGGAIERVGRLLRPGGRILCLEFAHDRFEARAAGWMALMARLLQVAGLAEAEAEGPADLRDAVERLRSGWSARFAGHGLHGYQAMRQALEQRFDVATFFWVPYLFVSLGNRLCGVEPERAAALISFLHEAEALQIERGAMPAVAFRFVGTPRVDR